MLRSSYIFRINNITILIQSLYNFFILINE
nr:MAG TPA: hypothetical protein [Crassvirales sp.]